MLTSIVPISRSPVPKDDDIFSGTIDLALQYVSERPQQHLSKGYTRANVICLRVSGSTRFFGDNEEAAPVSLNGNRFCFDSGGNTS